MQAVQLHARAAGSGLRLGLVADTHDDLVDWRAVSGQIAASLEGVNAILHCGDLCTEAALAALERIAPVFAVRSAADPPARPPTLVDGPRLVEGEGVTVGLLNALGAPLVEAEVADTIHFTGRAARDAALQFFGRPVDVAVFGGTHAPFVGTVDGILFVNPGSPSLAKERTLAILTLRSGSIGCRSVRLEPLA
jgi:uncharacterized protein